MSSLLCARSLVLGSDRGGRPRFWRLTVRATVPSARVPQPTARGPDRAAGCTSHLLERAGGDRPQTTARELSFTLYGYLCTARSLCVKMFVRRSSED